ncbi:MAG TPA: hypothetical protein VIN02_05540 [Sulfurovum sp.]
MKFIIDLIEDIREQTSNQPQFKLYAMLLKEDPQDSEKFIYGGEAPINDFFLNNEEKEMRFSLSPHGDAMELGDLIDHLVIYDMDVMMHPVKIAVNHLHPAVDVIGFGKNDEEKKYILFIKI